jgi:hypothetical protein
MTLAGHVDSNAEAGEPNAAARHIHEDIRWVDVFMYETSFMHLAQRTRERDRDAQEFGYFQGSAEPPIEGLATRILQHQRQAAVVAGQRDGPGRPGSTYFGAEPIFVFETLEGCERGVFRSDQQDWRQAIAATPVEGKVPSRSSANA